MRRRKKQVALQGSPQGHPAAHRGTAVQIHHVPITGFAGLCSGSSATAAVATTGGAGAATTTVISVPPSVGIRTAAVIAVNMRSLIYPGLSARRVISAHGRIRLVNSSSEREAVHSVSFGRLISHVHAVKKSARREGTIHNI